MTDLIVKKRITLEFLGDDYKDGYIVLKAVPMQEYEELVKRSEETAGDGMKSLKFIMDEVGKRFVEGELPVDGSPVKLSTSNLTQLPGEVFVEAMRQLTGALSPN